MFEGISLKADPNFYVLKTICETISNKGQCRIAKTMSIKLSYEKFMRKTCIASRYPSIQLSNIFCRFLSKFKIVFCEQCPFSNRIALPIRYFQEKFFIFSQRSFYQRFLVQQKNSEVFLLLNFCYNWTLSYVLTVQQHIEI